MMVDAPSRPAMIGSLRAMLAEPVRLQQRVGKPAAEHHADRGREEGHDGEEADLDPAHVPLGREIGREPGQKEDERGIAAELAEAGAPDLPEAQQRRARATRRSPLEPDVDGGASPPPCAM